MSLITTESQQYKTTHCHKKAGYYTNNYCIPSCIHNFLIHQEQRKLNTRTKHHKPNSTFNTKSHENNLVNLVGLELALNIK